MLIGLVVELTARVQAREDQLDAADLLLRMDVDRHAAAVVLDLARAVLEQGDVDGVAIAGERLIDAVVDDLVRQMIRARGVGVHARPPAHRIQAAQHLDVGGGIRRCHQITSLEGARSLARESAANQLAGHGPIPLSFAHMGIASAQNMARTVPVLPQPYGIRVRLKRGDPFAKLLGTDWQKTHWYFTAEERDRVLEEMSRKHEYSRIGDQPALVFEKVEKLAESRGCNFSDSGPLGRGRSTPLKGGAARGSLKSRPRNR